MTKPNLRSLQWQVAVKTFVSSIITGVIALSVAIYLLQKYTNALSFSNYELLSYLGLTLLVLAVFSFLFSVRNYQALKKPLDDLQQIAITLPLLSSNQYEQAREALNSIDGNHHLDEIKELQSAAIQLTNFLEILNDRVNQRSRELYSTNEILRGERDFIKNLLDTAQLIILTISEDMKVTLVNDYAEKITGIPEAELLNSDVSRFFPAVSWNEAQAYFLELNAGHIKIAQQDSELVDASGYIRHVSWLHSHLDIDSPNESILCVGMDMTEKKEAEKRVVWLAEHDPLTDLCNRRKFTEEFEKSLRTAIRYQHHNTLLFLDLDQFKDINDTSGHSAGDELLKLVAKTLTNVIRFTDLVARLGGDEFAILMPECDNTGAIIVANKIIEQLHKITLEYGAVKHKISASIGIVHFPLSDASIHELLGFADLAMYKAKSSGKGTYHVFSVDDQTQETLEARVYWKHQIEQALEKNLFVLNYQPILDISHNAIRHYEVLIRMKDLDTGELRLPGKFIQIAEEVGLIHQIDNYVIKKVFEKLVQLKQQGKKAKFAINLSGAVIDSPDILTTLENLIKKNKIDPQQLLFELTETAAVSNLEQAKSMMTEIRKLGCEFALDDFGVGFGSFNYMRELPVDIVKIDGLFIKNLDKNAADQLFVKALVDVATGLGKKTIAEFVENKATLDLLRSYGVTHAQGYHIGKPAGDLLVDEQWIEETEPEPIIFIE